MYARVVAAAIATVAAFAGALMEENRHPDRTRATVAAQTSDRWPNQTAQDWVTYADHVVAVTAVADESIEPSQVEIERGEGLILRQVNLRVDNLLWSAANPPRPVPESLDWRAWGWQFTDGSTSNRVKMVSGDTPRVETGHSYIIAIEWVPARCATGDEPEPAQWQGLGRDAIIPFDNQVIGQGELEGQTQSAARARRTAEEAGVNASLEDAMAGKQASDLAAVLNAAKPAEGAPDGTTYSSTACN